MKNKIMNIVIFILVVSFVFPSWIFSSTNLSDEQISQLEDKLRYVFQLQKRSVNNSMTIISRDVDNFLFGPGIEDKLLRYFNKHVKPGKKNKKDLWVNFQNEVINKKDFMEFIDEMAEVHFRTYDRIRREANREFAAMDVDCIPENDFENEKKKLREAVEKIWNMEEGELEQIISSAEKRSKELTGIEKMDPYVIGVSIILEIIGIWYPPLFWAGIVIFAGWYIYKDIIKKHDYKTEINTVQQRFMSKMRKQLKIISLKTKSAFEESSDSTYEELIKTMTKIIQKHYPQLRKENLR